MKIVMTTFGKNEQFVPYCVSALAHFWPEMSEVIIFSDRGNFFHDKKVISTESRWVPMVLECLKISLDRHLLNLDDIVVLLLEDHIPHDHISNDLINMLSNKLSDLGHTYVNLAGHGQGELVSVLEGTSLHRMEMDWFSSLHPAIWSVRHLLKMLHLATEQNQLSPWQFERLRMSGATHYTTGSCVWPSPFGGFLVNGMVNRRALTTMTAGPIRPLRRKLLMRLLQETPGRLWRRAWKRLSLTQALLSP